MFRPGRNPIGHIESLLPPFMLVGKATQDLSVRHDVVKVTDLEKLNDARVVGRVIVTHFPNRHGQQSMNEVRLRKIEIDERYRRLGIGRSIIQLIPDLPLPADHLSLGSPIEYVSTEIPTRPEEEKELMRFWENLEAQQVVKAAGHYRYQILRGQNDQTR